METGRQTCHIQCMTQEHTFTIKVHPRTFSEGRHRWTIFDNGLARYHSPESYATRREADFGSTRSRKGDAGANLRLRPEKMTKWPAAGIG